MPELVWVPVGHFGFVTSPSDRVTIGVFGVLFARFAFGIWFPGPVALARCKRGFAFSAFLDPNGFNGLLRTENVGFRLLRFQEGLQDGLCLGADGNTSDLTVVLVLVGPGLINPNIAGHVECDSPALADSGWGRDNVLDRSS